MDTSLIETVALIIAAVLVFLATIFVCFTCYRDNINKEERIPRPLEGKERQCLE